MIKGEIFTVERTVTAGTGYTYAPVQITGSVAFLGCEVEQVDKDVVGGMEVMTFTFQALQCGEATIQFAYFRPFDLSDLIYEEVLPFNVESELSSNSLGDWSPFEDPTDEDKAVFATAMKGLIGVTYVPLKVSKQIVNGINYRFVCDATPATLDPQSYKAGVRIYAPSVGLKPVITKIEKILG